MAHVYSKLASRPFKCSGLLSLGSMPPFVSLIRVVVACVCLKMLTMTSSLAKVGVASKERFFGAELESLGKLCISSTHSQVGESANKRHAILQLRSGTTQREEQLLLKFETVCV